ncbi:nodulin-related protein 1-like [Vigna unguiculata]|uniref:Nodulin-related protein 1 n=1 Tax=Vigna unguiculata TaxID=3917 RepID=A0A4D6L219_VIGUN|nr:nodulin-related protein 1-like [Vigna unguiculata]QCD82577.1 hypothetical protein DEO72_LG2g2917 [Vigna unguiculata]
MASEETQNKATTEQSSSELLASAKLVADAAQSTLRNESDKVDKAKVAGAAGDLLDAAGKYGKLDEQKGVGQYVDKAADYLHGYKDKAAAPSQSEDSKPQEGGGLAGGIANLAGGFFK